MAASAPYVDVLTWVFGNAAVASDQPIFVDAEEKGRRLDKGQCRTLVRHLVAGFKRLAAELALSVAAPAPAAAAAPAPPLAPAPDKACPVTGDDGPLADFTVCVHSFNDISYAALFLGIIGAGGRWTGSNPAYTAGELSHHLRISRSDFIITGPESLEQVVAAAKDCNLGSERIFVFNPCQEPIPVNLRSWNELLQHGEADWVTFNDKARATETTVALFSTSGTTGLPKMAARSHHSFVAESFALQDAQRKPYQVSRLLSVPFFHAFAAQVVLIQAMREGCITYVMRRFNRRLFLDTLHDRQITETAVVPPLILDFLSYTPAEQAKLSSLQLVWCAGARLDPLIHAKACPLFAPTARIVQVWGMSECGWISTFPYPESDDTGSVGRLIPGLSAKLIDDNGNDIVDDSCSGEICVKGPTLMRGYLGNDRASQESIDEHGWLRTGDIAYVKQGKIYIVDRKKELIKVRGWQLAPAEVEGTLLMHEGIADAAVIGIPCRDGCSELPRAYVVRAPGSDVQQEDIKAFLLTHLARYKVSDCEIWFREQIPKSASGKILRKILRAECNQARLADSDRPQEPQDEVSVSSTTQAEDSANAGNSADMLMAWHGFCVISAIWRWVCGMRLTKQLLAASLELPLIRWAHESVASH